MATTTPNIGLTLPIGGEHVSRQIINGNNTLIDAAVGTLDDKIADVRTYYDVGNISTKSGLDYWLNRAITDNSLSNNKKLLRFNCTGNFECFHSGVLYFVDLSVSTSNDYATALIQAIGYDQIFQAYKTSSGWTYNDKITSTTWTEFTTTSTNYTFVSNQNTKCAYIKRGGFCYVNLYVTCVSPQSSSEQLCTLPTSLTGIKTLQIPLSTDFDNGTSGIRFLLQNSILYARGGTAGRSYGVSFVYPYD